MKRRVCIIGLDGVGLHNLNVFRDNLAVSGITTITNNGFSTSPLSIPPYTPCSWTSIFTGVNPGKHGIYGFFNISRRGDGFSVSLGTSFSVMYPRIFEMASMFGLKSVVINVPLTYPVKALAGLNNIVVVSDWASPRQFIYPKYYMEKYKELLVDPPHTWARATNVKLYVKAVEYFLEKRLDLYYELLDEGSFDLYVIIFSELDWLFHKIPDVIKGHKLNYIYKVVSLIDKFVRKAVETCDLVILVSDHGFNIVNILLGVNRILFNEGFIHLNYKLNPNKFRKFKDYESIILIENSNKNALSNAFSTALLRFFTFVSSLLPTPILAKLESFAPISTSIDYSRSKAFMIEASNWGLYVKRGYLDMVKKFISTRINLIAKVLEKHDIFWGPYINRAPDLIIVPQDHTFFDTRIHTEPVHMTYISEHDSHALLALYGDAVEKAGNKPDGDSNVEPSLFDIVPTILAYLGLPLPHDSDGRPLLELLDIDPQNIVRKYNYLYRFKLARRATNLSTRFGQI